MSIRRHVGIRPAGLAGPTERPCGGLARLPPSNQTDTVHSKPAGRSRISVFQQVNRPPMTGAIRTCAGRSEPKTRTVCRWQGREVRNATNCPSKKGRSCGYFVDAAVKQGRQEALDEVARGT